MPRETPREVRIPKVKATPKVEDQEEVEPELSVDDPEEFEPKLRIESRLDSPEELDDADVNSDASFTAARYLSA